MEVIQNKYGNKITAEYHIYLTLYSIQDKKIYNSTY